MPTDYSDHYDAIYPAPIASLGLKMEGDCLIRMDWLPDNVKEQTPRIKSARTIFTILDRYFEYPGNIPVFPFSLRGTDFQRRVWLALKQIPIGQVMTYGELAAKLKTSSRAVGQACRTNPICVLIPCHRVVARNGFGGYMGKNKQLRIKEWLLKHEGVAWQAALPF